VCGKSAGDPFAQVRDRLAGAASLVVVTHARPDGDALGSAVALSRAAAAAGKDAFVVVPDALPERYAFLFPDGPPHPAERFESLAEKADLVVVVDTCAAAQLDGLVSALDRLRTRTVVVDHHTTRGDVGVVQCIDTSAAATGLLVGELLDELGWTVDHRAAEALIVAIVSDTGWLHFSNTDGRALRAVAHWVEQGVRMEEVYGRLHESGRLSRVKLLQRMLGSLELHFHGKLAVMTLREEDFIEAEAGRSETEDLINEAFRIAGVEAAALFIENPDRVRVSLRSKGAIDVAELAGAFGGGGHPRAAGLWAEEDLPRVKQRVIGRFAKAMRD